MENTLEYKFANNDLQFHLPKILDSFKDQPELYGDESAMPLKSGAENDGDGKRCWYLDIPSCEESYFYYKKAEMNADYKKLTHLIDLQMQKNDTCDTEPFEPYNKEWSGE